MKPTKEELQELHTRLVNAQPGWLPGVGRFVTVSFKQKEIKNILHALCLAVNLPSENEIEDILYGTEMMKCEDDYVLISDAASAIKARIEGEKK